jgi:hypothetical protein
LTCATWCGILARRQRSPSKTKSNKQKNMDAEPKTIDATPTWSEMLDFMFHLLENSTGKANQNVRLEFARMAATADAYIASTKEKKISG